MATVTPTYSWPVPTSTDYVADGAVAIEALGDAIDATVSTALGGAYPGLRLVKKQTIGSGVSSVIVTSAFSATYENYLVVVNNTEVSTLSASLSVQMRTGTSTATTNYNGVYQYWAYNGAAGSASNSGATNWGNVGRGLAANDKVSFGFNLFQPFLANKTSIQSLGTTGTDLTGQYTGYHNTAASYDQVVITCSGTMTSGTIYVYGYGIS
jgi:hypothetical protein